MFFRNPDFTDYVPSSFPITEDQRKPGSGGPNATFDESSLKSVGDALHLNRLQHSIVVVGGIRFDHNQNYTLEFQTNYKLRAYLAGELLVEKDNHLN